MKTSTVRDVGIFLLSLSTFFKLALGGEIFVGDLLAVLIVSYCIIVYGRLRILTVGFVLAAAVLIIYQPLLDYLIGTVWDDTVRSAMQNVTTVLNLIALTCIAANWPARFPLILLGMGISLVLSTYLNPNEFAEANLWKYGASQGAFLALIAGGFMCMSRYLLSLNYRWLVAFYAGAMLYALQSLRSDSRTGLMLGLLIFAMGLLFTLFRKVGRGTLAAVVGGVLLVIPLYFQLYSALAEQGLFGEEARARMEFIQGASGDTGLFGSRSQIFESLWHSANALPLGEGSAPSGFSQHSHIVTAIAETGVVGLTFWVVILLIIFRRFSDSLGKTPALFLGIYCGALGQLMVNILFEPLAGYNRLLTPAHFAIVTCFLPVVWAQIQERAAGAAARQQRRFVPLSNLRRRNEAARPHGATMPQPEGDEA
jgi:hypothetical protein